MPKVFLCLALLLGLTQSAILLLVPAILEATQIAFSAIGGAIFVGAFVRILCAPLCGRLSDWMGAKRVIGGALILIAASYLCLIFLFMGDGDSAVVWLVLNRICVAAGSAGVMPVMQNVLSARYVDKALSTKVALLNNGFYGGILVGPVMMVALMHLNTFLPLYLLLAWSILSFCWLLFPWQQDHLHGRSTNTGQARQTKIWGLFPIFLSEGLFCCVIGGLQIILGVYVQDKLQVSSQTATLYLSGLLSLTSASMIVTQLIFARVAKVQGAVLIFIAVSGGLVGVCLLQVASSLWYFYLAMVFIGLGTSCLHPWGVWAISKRLDTQNKGWALGLLSASATAGNALGAGLFPLLFETKADAVLAPMAVILLFIGVFQLCYRCRLRKNG
jgi:MFS family permease